jgi:hypothetical protein
MNLFATPRPIDASLSATITRRNGTIEDHGIVSEDRELTGLRRFVNETQSRLLSFARKFNGRPQNLVTNGGMSAVAANFLAGASPLLTAFTFHDSGTSNTAPTISDTGLTSPVGIARVSGTNSIVSSLVLKSTATITYASAGNIQEWGLFSAATSGICFDHRVIPQLSIEPGDSVVFNWLCNFVSGGA